MKINKEEKEEEEEEEKEEEEPEWANDNVENFINKEIKFESIPKSLESKYNNDNTDILFLKNEKNKEENFDDNKININVENFFFNGGLEKIKESSNFVDI